MTEKSRCGYEIMKKKKKKKSVKWYDQEVSVWLSNYEKEKSVKLYIVVLMTLCKWKNLLNYVTEKSHKWEHEIGNVTGIKFEIETQPPTLLTTKVFGWQFGRILAEGCHLLQWQQY